MLPRYLTCRKLVPGIVCALALAGCGGSASRPAAWRQFHADRPSQGSLLVDSAVALQPRWTADVEVSNNSSPVVDEDGTIYVGSAANGELVAVSPDGEVEWRTSVAEERSYVSSPALGASDRVYIISTEREDDDLSSTLHQVGADGTSIESVALPDGGFTTASPKVWSAPEDGNELIFVNASIGGPQLLVYDGDLGLIHQERIGTACAVTGSSPLLDSIFDFLSDLWDAWTNIPADFDTSGPGVDEWLLPTVAIVDSENITPAGEPIVVFVGTCGVTAHRWNGPDELTFMWLHKFGDRGVRTSSPAVVLAGVVVVGTERNKVVALDVQTGAPFWEFEADEEILKVPAALLRQVYVASRTTLYMIDSNGDLLDTRPLAEPNYTAPAVSASHVYVAAGGGLNSFSLDLTDSAVDGDFHGWLSSPSIGGDGTVYAVNQEGDLWAYPGR